MYFGYSLKNIPIASVVDQDSKGEKYQQDKWQSSSHDQPEPQCVDGDVSWVFSQFCVSKALKYTFIVNIRC